MKSEQEQINDLLSSRHEVIRAMLIFEEQLNMYNESITTWEKSKSNQKELKLSQLHRRVNTILESIKICEESKQSIENDLTKINKNWKRIYTHQKSF